MALASRIITRTILNARRCVDASAHLASWLTATRERAKSFLHVAVKRIGPKGSNPY